MQKIKYLESESVIRFMEKDILGTEQKIKQLEAERDKKATQSPINMKQVVEGVVYFLENLDKLLLKQIDPVKKAQFLLSFFSRIPTYEELELELKTALY